MGNPLQIQTSRYVKRRLSDFHLAKPDQDLRRPKLNPAFAKRETLPIAADYDMLANESRKRIMGSAGLQWK